jgi:hypothetical protein
MCKHTCVTSVANVCTYVHVHALHDDYWQPVVAGSCMPLAVTTVHALLCRLQQAAVRVECTAVGVAGSCACPAFIHAHGPVEMYFLG